jgi:hypothetical protein
MFSRLSSVFSEIRLPFVPQLSRHEKLPIDRDSVDQIKNLLFQGNGYREIRILLKKSYFKDINNSSDAEYVFESIKQTLVSIESSSVKPAEKIKLALCLLGKLKAAQPFGQEQPYDLIESFARGKLEEGGYKNAVIRHVEKLQKKAEHKIIVSIPGSEEIDSSGLEDKIKDYLLSGVGNVEEELASKAYCDINAMLKTAFPELAGDINCLPHLLVESVSNKEILTKSLKFLKKHSIPLNEEIEAEVSVAVMGQEEPRSEYLNRRVGCTPLHVAQKLSNKVRAYNATQALIEAGGRGVGINAVDKEGKTALKYALENGYKKNVELLISLGAITANLEEDASRFLKEKIMDYRVTADLSGFEEGLRVFLSIPGMESFLKIKILLSSDIFHSDDQLIDCLTNAVDRSSLSEDEKYQIFIEAVKLHIKYSEIKVGEIFEYKNTNRFFYVDHSKNPQRLDAKKARLLLKLFPQGIQKSDFRQKNIGDCTLLAALKAAIYNDPVSIIRIIEPADSNIVKFNFVLDGKEKPIVLEASILNRVTNRINDDKTGVEGCLGVRLLEAAFGQLLKITQETDDTASVHSMDSVVATDSIKSFDTTAALDRGSYADKALKVLFPDLQVYSFGWTLKKSQEFDAMRALLKISKSPRTTIAVAACGKGDGKSLHANHAYAILKVQPNIEQIILSNPWDSVNEITISYGDFLENFYELTYTEVRSRGSIRARSAL